MIAGLVQSGALPALERLVQFTSARHRVLTHNIANLSTPYFKPTDLDPKAFQEALGKAVDQRRRQPNPNAKPLQMQDTRQLKFTEAGLAATPQPLNENVLFHDENNRDLERTMQRLAENTLAHNAGVEMLRNQFQMLRSAIREQP